MPQSVVHNRVIVCLLMLFAFGSQLPGSESVRAQPLGNPVLITSSVTITPLGQIDVSGNGFTPNGIVRVSLVTLDDAEFVLTRNILSTAQVWGPNGSMDPALGFDPGGSISFQFWQHANAPMRANGSMDPAQPLVTTVEIDWMESAIYGPNGSMDPANGYLAQDSINVVCGTEIHFRAYDMASGASSNILAHVATCNA